MYYNVRKDKKEGIYDCNGRELVAPYTFDDISIKRDGAWGYYKVRKDGFEGIYTKEGRAIIDPSRYNSISWTKEGYYDVEIMTKDGKKTIYKHGICNKYGEELLPPILEGSFVFYNSDLGFYTLEDEYFHLFGYKIDNYGNLYAFTPQNSYLPCTKEGIARWNESIKKEQRKERWLKVAKVFADVAVGFSAYIIKKRQQESLSGLSGNKNVGGISNLSGKAYLLDPNYIKVQYLQETNNGKSMSFDQWLNLKAPVGEGFYTGNSTGEANESNSSFSSSTSRKACTACKYTNGKCPVCKGTGRKSDNSFGISQTAKCDNCGGDGKCPACGGDGWR